MTRIHPSAVVEAGAKLAEDVEIGAHAYVGAEVELASGRGAAAARLRHRPHHARRGQPVFPFAVLGEEPQDHSFSGESTSSWSAATRRSASTP